MENKTIKPQNRTPDLKPAGIVEGQNIVVSGFIKIKDPETNEVILEIKDQ